MNNEENQLLIPFGRAVRVGNYKLWRGKFAMKDGKEKTEIECLHVSNLDGSWMVRIPATVTMYTLVCNGYATVDEKLRENFLGMLFSNMLNCCTSGSEALHDAFFFLTEMMAFPYLLLPENEMEKRMKHISKDSGMDKGRAKKHIGKMMEYRRQLYELIEQKKARFIDSYERQQALRRENARSSEEEELKRDEIAEQAMDIVNQPTN